MSEAQDITQTKQGPRVSGKPWKVSKDAFRVKALCVPKSTFEKRKEKDLAEAAIKAKFQELKQEKADAKTARIEALRERRAKKAEKERYEKMATKMHAKRVERLKKREKRNKLLKER